MRRRQVGGPEFFTECVLCKRGFRFSASRAPSRFERISSPASSAPRDGQQLGRPKAIEIGGLSKLSPPAFSRIFMTSFGRSNIRDYGRLRKTDRGTNSMHFALPNV